MILKHLSSTLVGKLEHYEVGFLLREGGKAVHVIKKKTNTLIKFICGKGEGKEAVHIYGYEEDKVKAWSLILSHIGSTIC